MILSRVLSRYFLAPFVLFLALFSHLSLAKEKPDLTIAISLDIPPYVMQQATYGLEVDIARHALRDYKLHFIQLPYGELQKVISKGKVDGSIGVKFVDDSTYYSVDFITFANYAITKKVDGLTINGIGDLENHQVSAWQNAYLVLGNEFKQLFSPESPQRKNYTELADQREQVSSFWQGKQDVAVIDLSIFTHFSKEMGHSMDEVSLHPIFPPITNYKVGFKDREVRDQFNSGWNELCESGKYDMILKLYDVALERTACR